MFSAFSASLPKQHCLPMEANAEDEDRDMMTYKTLQIMMMMTSGLKWGSGGVGVSKAQ